MRLRGGNGTAKGEALGLPEVTPSIENQLGHIAGRDLVIYVKKDCCCQSTIVNIYI